jgi:hypothetical protein
MLSYKEKNNIHILEVILKIKERGYNSIGRVYALQV